MQRGKLNSGKELDYAFGLVHGKYRGLPTIGHGGADAGYRADLIRFPDQHFSVACLCNKGEINPGGLTHKVADIYLADQFKESAPAKTGQSEKPVTVSAEHLTRYAGLYWKKEDEQAFRIVFRDGKLFLSFSDEDRMELTPRSENRFQPADSPVTFLFDGVADAKAQRMTIEPPGGGEPEVFERVAEFQPTPSQLAGYVGSYVSDEIDPVYRIVVENGSLVLKRSKSKPRKLEPAMEDYFREPGSTLHFQKDAAGRVTGFVLNSGRIHGFRFRKS